MQQHGDATRPQLVAIAVCITLIVASTLAGPSALRVAPLAATLALVAVHYRRLFAWPSLITGLILIILFIPIRRYTIALNLPFQLEPYRIYVLLLLGMWIVSLLIDDRLPFRGSGLGAPLFAIGGVLVASVFVNADRVYRLGLGTEVAKSLTFWLSWVVVLVIVASVTVRSTDVERALKVLVGGGAVLGVLGLIEFKTGFNPFNNLERVLPILRFSETPSADQTFRAGLTRAYASAQHPIAYGAVLAVLVPPAIFLAYRRRAAVWWLALLCLVVGSITSVSRTTIVMLATSGIMILVLRPESRRLLPLLLPLAVVAQIAVPGTFGTYRQLFFPTGGIVAQQGNAAVGQGRVSSLGPALDQAAEHPLLGLGYGTRIPVGEKQNSFILDDQWLSTLLDTGILGVVAWVWFFWRFGRGTAREGKDDKSDRGWMLTVISASVTSFAVGILFYDAFSFIQVTIITFILIGLGCALLRLPRGDSATPGTA